MDKVLVLGLGNILLRDEGLGVRALELFCRRYQLPPQVEVCDGDCQGLELLPWLEGVSHLLVVDAAEMRKPAGTIERLEGDEIDQHWEWKLSAHETGLLDVLGAAALTGHRFDKVVLLGMQPGSTTLGTDLGPVVRAALPRLVRMMAGELAGWGAALKPRPQQRTPQAVAR